MNVSYDPIQQVATIDLENGLPAMQVPAESFLVSYLGYDATVATGLIDGSVEVHIEVLNVAVVPWMRREARNRWVAPLRRLV